jgi:hypothetical protein
LQLISRAGKLIKGTVFRTGPAFLYNIAPKSVQSSNQCLLLAMQQGGKWNAKASAQSAATFDRRAWWNRLQFLLQ